MFEFMVTQGQPGIGSGNKMYIEQAEGYLTCKWGMTSLLLSAPTRTQHQPINIDTRGKKWQTEYP